MSSTDEVSLVRKAQQGDREVLGHLWDLLTPKLFGYLVNTLHDRALAEDILQTTWLKAIGGLSKYTDRNLGISAWLFAIAKNECREYWRKAGREVPLDPVAHDVDGSDQKASEEKMFAQNILAQLGETDREILRLRYIADLSLKEIATVLQLSSVSVRVRIHRALAHARATLAS